MITYPVAGLATAGRDQPHAISAITAWPDESAESFVERNVDVQGEGVTNHSCCASKLSREVPKTAVSVALSFAQRTAVAVAILITVTTLL